MENTRASATVNGAEKSLIHAGGKTVTGPFSESQAAGMMTGDSVTEAWSGTLDTEGEEKVEGGILMENIWASVAMKKSLIHAWVKVVTGPYENAAGGHPGRELRVRGCSTSVGGGNEAQTDNCVVHEEWQWVEGDEQWMVRMAAAKVRGSKGGEEGRAAKRKDDGGWRGRVERRAAVKEVRCRMRQRAGKRKERH